MVTRSKSKESTKPEMLIYIGPPVMGLSSRKILGKTIPAFMHHMIVQCPAVARLIIPIRGLRKATEAARMRGSQVSADMQAVRECFGRPEIRRK